MSKHDYLGAYIRGVIRVTSHKEKEAWSSYRSAQRRTGKASSTKSHEKTAPRFRENAWAFKKEDYDYHYYHAEYLKNLEYLGV